jgi:hypothetical protein
MGFRLPHMDVLALSHDELVALILEQQATIAALEATIARLEQRVRDLETGTTPPRRMPGHQPTAAVKGDRSPRTRRGVNPVRRRSQPDAQRFHALDRCPRCGAPLAGGSIKRRREVIEISPAPALVTEHVALERCCPDCHARVTPRIDLTGQVVGQSRLGVGLVSLIATLRAEWRLPLGAIHAYLTSVHRVSLSVGGIVGALRQVARAGATTVETTLAAIRASPVVHADETGWREDGVNRYLWSFATPTHRYYTSGGRQKAIVDTVLGPAFSGVLVSDFYAAYDHYDGLQQKCWAHLLRDIDTLVRQEPGDAGVAAWADRVHGLYQRAVAAAAVLPGIEEDARRAAWRGFQVELSALCHPFVDDPDAPQAGLCRRIAKYLHALFVFVLVPGVPATNNLAERSVRHEVISRKISGGTRSADGTQTRTTLATLFGTWRAQGRDPFIACRELLASLQA